MTDPDRLPLDDLIPNETNAKAHSVEEIRASIRRFGFVTPMVIDARTGKLAEGHGRSEALQAERASGLPAPKGIEVDKDGRWLVPVHRGWASANDQEATAFLVAANRLVELGGWDDQALLQALETARATPTGLEGIGYAEPDISALLARIEADSRPILAGDPDEVPEPPAEPVSKKGDVWLLGPHRVMCGDATASNDVERVTAGKVADLLWTDPPYGVDYVGKTADALTIANDDLGGLDLLLKGVLTCADSVLVKGAPYYIAGPPGPPLVAFFEALATVSWPLRQVLVWVKDSMVLGYSDYHYQHEVILYGYKPGGGRRGRGAAGWNGGNAQTTVFQVPRPKRSESHPTMKPVDLVARCLANSAPAPGLVFDPFLGSGSTLIAAHQLGRTCYGMEIDPHYVDVICARFEALTNDKPILEATGEPHSFLAAP